ncbi:TetR/AcrR family transcriptional regulator [Nocardia gamkensis]|uniref:TetR/AcrR family transcriptional regulator n=1 Tax=Nocardia gamkensis TaxID=352869 RepID=A0A7X6L6A7_9NOCA|nr:TetR/AcrR family transcriptional regulator [Nocardia gamkensis]NKY28606.1 TetR/AcrR family transcriptional regulator [Nocardia gamkensis]NQE71239.1 HTH-type transcriptional regulator AcrR [Nocardia gamkensis]
MDRRRSDTRERIRSVAMELFSERGYEKTSLREIAERLGITKAALYYHFRTKEDIVASLSEDLRRGIDDIVEWAESAPPGPERARQIVSRYGALLHGLGKDMIRFWAENQPAFRDLGFGTSLRYQFRVLAGLMTQPDSSPLAEFHARQALLAISWSLSMMGDLDISDEDSYQAATGIASSIVDRMGQP